MRIVITLPDDTEITERLARLLFADALSEFVAHRGPTPAAYVARRYPDTPDYAWLNREQKTREVTERIRAANTLHSAVLALTLEE